MSITPLFITLRHRILKVANLIASGTPPLALMPQTKIDLACNVYHQQVANLCPPVMLPDTLNYSSALCFNLQNSLRQLSKDSFDSISEPLTSTASKNNKGIFQLHL